MESARIANNYEKASEEEYEQESLLLIQSEMQEEIFQSENGPVPFYRGWIFAVPISLLMWGIIIWAFN
jgi:hypothetical protein